jgi:hypothetical protein
VCLASRLLPEGGARRVVQAMLHQRVYAASLRARGACLGLLVLLRAHLTSIARQPGDSLMEKIMAVQDWRVGGREFWNSSRGPALIYELMVGAEHASKSPVDVVRELHQMVRVAAACTPFVGIERVDVCPEVVLGWHPRQVVTHAI